jgi:antitoxin component of RelBE/YafQ-DinJ toxin-antitoxin module
MDANEAVLNMNIDRELKRRAKVYAAENDTTMTDVISCALKSFLDDADGINADTPEDDKPISIH